MRNCVSPLCFKGQVPDLSLFVFPEPSPWGPTPLIKGRWTKARGDRERCRANARRMRGPLYDWPHPQQAHSTLIPNICIQTSYKGTNFSLFERLKASLVKGRGTAEGGGGIPFSAEVPKDRIPQSPPDGGDSPLSQGGHCANPNKEEFYLWRPVKQPIIS